MISKPSIEIALACKVRDGKAPARRIGSLHLDIPGHLPAREEPHLDAVGLPVDGEDASAVAVEGLAEAVRLVRAHRAAHVRRLVRREGVAVRIHRLARLRAVGCDAAVLGRMQHHRVARLGIDALDQVDLAAGGPRLTEAPDGRPQPAHAGRHVRDIGDHQDLVVRLLGRQTHARPARDVVHVLRVDGDACAVGAGFNQAACAGGGLVDIPIRISGDLYIQGW